MGVQLPEWMAGEYTVIRADRTTAMVRNDFVESFQRHRLMDCPHAPVLSLPEMDDGGEGSLAGGRGGIRVVAAGSLGEAVVRPYRRGGLIPNAPPAAVLLAPASQATAARILESMGRAIRLLHESGGVHADLNAHNVLVSERGEGPAFVIDLDRVALTACPAPARRTRASLLRLRRSCVKLGLDEAVRDWDRLERGYSAPPEPPPAA
jgi:hypothetical protein